MTPKEEQNPAVIIARGRSQMDVLNCKKKQYMTINKNEQGKYYIGLQRGNNGYCTYSWAEYTSQLINYALELGGSLERIKDMARGKHCPKAALGALSCLDALARHLDDEIKKNVDR
jgi:hypothetical protein